MLLQVLAVCCISCCSLQIFVDCQFTTRLFVLFIRSVIFYYVNLLVSNCWAIWGIWLTCTQFWRLSCWYLTRNVRLCLRRFQRVNMFLPHPFCYKKWLWNSRAYNIFNSVAYMMVTTVYVFSKLIVCPVFALCWAMLSVVSFLYFYFPWFYCLCYACTIYSVGISYFIYAIVFIWNISFKCSDDVATYSSILQPL